MDLSHQKNVFQAMERPSFYPHQAEHIYFVDGIQIVDCIEFNERFRYQDIASDFAFLLVDSDCKKSFYTGQYLLNRYVDKTNDYEAYIRPDFYKCYRAFVRCKTKGFRM